MDLLKFIETRPGSRVCLVADPGDLPKVGHGWNAAGTVTVTPGGQGRIGASDDEIIAGITADRYYMWPKE